MTSPTPVAQPVPETTYDVQASHERRLPVLRQNGNRLERLCKHAYQGSEIALVLQPDFVAEANCALAKKRPGRVTAARPPLAVVAVVVVIRAP